LKCLEFLGLLNSEKIENSDNFLCPYCVLELMDPLNEVKETLIYPFLFKLNENESIKTF
jgi:hypothetical protein